MYLKKEFKIFVLLIFFGLLFSLFYSSLFKKKDFEPRVMIGKQLPNLSSKSLFYNQDINIKKIANHHLFLINIFARGGLIHLGIYIYFIFNLLRERKSFAIINFVAPLFLASLFDASMENSHFPLIFYFVVGFSLCSKKVFKI